MQSENLKKQIAAIKANSGEKKQPFPGWRTMSGVARRNEKMHRIFSNAEKLTEKHHPGMAPGLHGLYKKD